MWEKGANAYGDTFASVTGQAADALLDAAAVPRTALASAKAVYKVTPATFPTFNAPAVPAPQIEPPEDLLSNVSAPPQFAVLDVATGPGMVVAKAVAERGASRVVGVDTSAAMIELAKKRNMHLGEAASFVVGDAAKLPLEDGTFDAVVLGFVLLHLPDPQAALKEAFRVCKPGGKVSYSVWQPPPANKGFSLVLDAIAEHGNPQVELPGAPLPFFHFADPKNAATALEAAGFAADSVQVQTIPCTAALAAPDELFQYFATATARTRATLEMQTDAQRDAIRAAMAAKVAHGYRGVYLDGQSRSTSFTDAVPGSDMTLSDGQPSGRCPFQVPMPCVVASATKR